MPRDDLDPTPPRADLATAAPPQRRARWRRGIRIAAQIGLGLGLGLVAAEAAFWARDEGAFPHVNFYVEDPALGVRLQPGAEMRFRLRANPLTRIRVNAQGYRGADWPAPPQAGEIVVLGDSQVFGLGVDDDQTFSAELAARTGRPVRNAGVPTYGPLEYRDLARELLAARRPATVVVVINYANDPFELGRPNTQRHAVWDGWAVRSETAPAHVRWFPGRRWLFSRSHAVYAVRRWLHGREPAGAEDGAAPALDVGTPSEGVWQDLVHASERTREQLAAARAEAERTLASSRARVGELEKTLADERAALDELDYQRELAAPSSFDLKIAAAQPGDIVEDERAEASRSIALTAEMIRRAAERRDAFAKQRRAAERARAEQTQALASATETLVEERARLIAQLAAGGPRVRPTTPFDAYLQELRALCDAHGAELVVVALPIDVQVDAREWLKYGVEDGPDMGPSQVLLTDLVANAEDLRIRALDATAALREAGPGAFLDHDIHMTPQGHRALAAALADRLARPLPPRAPEPGLPAGTRFVPAEAAWKNPVVLKVDDAAGLFPGTTTADGWLRIVFSNRAPGGRIERVAVTEGGSPTTMRMRTGLGVWVVTPLTPGAPVTVRAEQAGKRSEVQIRWRPGADGPEPTVATVALPAGDPPGELDPPLLPRDLPCLDPYDWGEQALLPACVAQYPGRTETECDALRACVRHDPLFPPPCPEGSAHAFAANTCFALCDADNPCSQGTCTPWQGAAVCL